MDFDPFAKSARFALMAGHFLAQMRPPHKDSNALSVLVCQFRIISNGNLWAMEKLSEKLIDGKGQPLGQAWQGKTRCGYSIDRIAPMRFWATALLTRGTSFDRFPVASAWEDCVHLLPTLLKQQMAGKGRRYRAVDFEDQRVAACKELRRLNRVLPPLYPRGLPADYFDPWRPDEVV